MIQQLPVMHWVKDNSDGIGDDVMPLRVKLWPHRLNAWQMQMV